MKSNNVDRNRIFQLINDILRRQGKIEVAHEQAPLRDIGFRSLDFSELALRLEREAKRELTFDARSMRAITTVADVLDFFERAMQNA